MQRDASAAAQGALLRAARRIGAAVPPAAAIAGGHLDAARRAAAAGCAALTFEPAARQHGLAFTALEEHVVELRVDGRWAGHPGVAALGDLLASAALARRVALVGAYDLTGCGDLAGAR